MRIFLLAALVASAAAHTLTVSPTDPKADYMTLSAGLAAAKPGDTVRALPGLYRGAANLQIAWTFGNVTLEGAGQDETIIDGELKPVYYSFAWSTGAGGVLRDLTIANCTTTGGVNAVIDIKAGSPRFERVALVGNGNAQASGGARLHEPPPPRPTFVDCAFERNVAGVGRRGVRRTGTSAPAFTRCSFRHNTAVGGGGGAVFGGYWTAQLVFTECAFTDNAAQGRFQAAASIAYSGASPTLRRCRLARNAAATLGGGRARRHAWRRRGHPRRLHARGEHRALSAPPSDGFTASTATLIATLVAHHASPSAAISTLGGATLHLVRSNFSNN